MKDIAYPITNVSFETTPWSGVDQEGKWCEYDRTFEVWRVVGKASSHLSELESLRAQVAGLTKGISKFMCDEKSLRKRLAEQETALRKRKKQVQANSEQINYLMADLYFEHLCNMLSNYTDYAFTFEEWKDRWLRNRGYKEAV
jgi:regulator of replication initiation timing